VIRTLLVLAALVLVGCESREDSCTAPKCNPAPLCGANECPPKYTARELLEAVERMETGERQ